MRIAASPPKAPAKRSAPAAATGGWGRYRRRGGRTLRIPSQRPVRAKSSLTDIHRDVAGAALGGDEEQNRVPTARARRRDQRENVARRMHRLVGDGKHHIAGLNALVTGIAVGIDARNEHA